MKVKSSVLLGLIMLFCLMGGLALLSRLKQEKDVWSPADMYSTVGGSHGSAYTTVSYGSASSAGSSMPVYLKSGSTLRRRAAFSYAHVMPSPNRAGGSSVVSTSTSSPQGGLYTTSSAEFRSFGGGGNMGRTVSGGSVKAAVSSVASVSLTGVSSIAIPALSHNSNSSLAFVSDGDVLSVVSNDIALSSSISSMSGSIGSSISNDSYFTLPYATATYGGIGNIVGGARRMGGRQNIPGISDNYLAWLLGYYGETSTSVTMDELKSLYVSMTGDTDFSNMQAWEAFLAWFEGKQSDENFGWYWAPVSDALPFLLLLCVIYAIVVYIRTGKIKEAELKKMKIQNKR